MKLSNQQAQMLLQVLSDSLRMDLGKFFSYPHGLRSSLYKEIIEQQDNKPIEIGDE